MILPVRTLKKHLRPNQALYVNRMLHLSISDRNRSHNYGAASPTYVFNLGVNADSKNQYLIEISLLTAAANFDEQQYKLLNVNDTVSKRINQIVSDEMADTFTIKHSLPLALRKIMCYENLLVKTIANDDLHSTAVCGSVKKILLDNFRNHANAVSDQELLHAFHNEIAKVQQFIGKFKPQAVDALSPKIPISVSSSC